MDIRGFNKTARWTLYTTGAILIALGIAALLHPMLSAVAMGVCMGIGFLIAGSNNLVPYFSMRGNALRPKWLLPLGALDITLGALFLLNVGLAALTLSALLGGWLFFAGATRLWMSLQLRAAGHRRWWMTAASGALFLLGAFVLFAQPFATVFAMTLLAGCILLAAGLTVIAEGKLLYPPMPRGEDARGGPEKR